MSAPERRHDGARDDEEVGRAVDEEEPEVPPAVAEAGQLGLTAAGVYSTGSCSMRVPVLEARMTISEANSIPVVRKSRRGKDVAADRSHTAVRVADARTEEGVEGPAQDGVPDVAVKEGHRPGLDVVHAIADHQVGAALQLGEEARQVLEIVGEVGVGHQDVGAACRSEAGKVSASVAAPWLVDDPRTGRDRQFVAAVD